MWLAAAGQYRQRTAPNRSVYHSSSGWMMLAAGRAGTAFLYRCDCCAQVSVLRALQMFTYLPAFLFFFFSWCERGFGAWEGLCLEVCTCGSRTSRVLVSAHDKESSLIKALLNIWEHIFLDMLNCGQTSSTCFAVVSLETSQKWWKFWARVRVCQAFGSGCVNKGTTDFASINSADL